MCSASTAVRNVRASRVEKRSIRAVLRPISIFSGPGTACDVFVRRSTALFISSILVLSVPRISTALLFSSLMMPRSRCSGSMLLLPKRCASARLNDKISDNLCENSLLIFFLNHYRVNNRFLISAGLFCAGVCCCKNLLQIYNRFLPHLQYFYIRILTKTMPNY